MGDGDRERQREIGEEKREREREGSAIPRSRYFTNEYGFALSLLLL